MTFRSEERDGAELLTLDIPPLNTLEIEAVRALEAHFTTRPADRPLLLTGSGRAFSAGVDVKAFTSYSETERDAFFKAITRMVAALCATKAPVVAALNGHAMGGGFVLALCADYRIAVEDGAKFGLTEAAAGVPFPAGPVEVVAAEIPAALRRHMTLTSAVIPAATLREHLVFDEIAPADGLLERAETRLRALAAQPAFAAVKAQTRGPLIRRLSELAAER